MLMENSEYYILHRLGYDLNTELNKPICLLVCEKESRLTHTKISEFIH
jgi:hypothetical protein